MCSFGKLILRQGKTNIYEEIATNSYPAFISEIRAFPDVIFEIQRQNVNKTPNVPVTCAGKCSHKEKLLAEVSKNRGLFL